MTVSRDRFQGTLLGLALGEAFGLPHAGTPPGALERPKELSPPPGRLPLGQYGAGTQVALEVTESLIGRRAVDGKDIAARIAGLYRDNRIIGRAEQDREAVSRLLTGTTDWTSSGAPRGRVSPTGSFRSLPLGLYYLDDEDQLREQSVSLARITHKDPRTSAIALCSAAIVASLVSAETIEPIPFTEGIADTVRPVDDGAAEAMLEVGRWAHDPDDLGALVAASAAMEKGSPRPDTGQGARGAQVLVSALVAFFRGGDDFLTCMGAALKAGGHTDQTAGLAGAFAGAYGGVGALPRHLADVVTDRDQRGREDIEELAGQLHALKFGRG